jgi:hypothetical protein
MVESGALKSNFQRLFSRSTDSGWRCTNFQQLCGDQNFKKSKLIAFYAIYISI